ncbi:MAG: hypothetical protein JXB26_15025 [Candidatus Aminicenantes bacterium]|nr:hypothetical protein [Candidatus Aminicenantes bacterium]
MLKTRFKARILVLVPLLLMLCSCFKVRVVQNCRNAEFRFRRAAALIENIHRRDPERRGRVKGISVLFYNKEDRSLVTAYCPLWVIETAIDISLRAADHEDDFDFEERYHFNWRDADVLKKLGPGLIAEIDDEEIKIMVWLK